MKPIVLYDENHERVGETYPRRAKQLLRSGRAFWLEEGSTMRLITAIDETYPPTKEDVLPMTEPVMQNNGMAVESTPPPITPTGSDDLLMYIAKQNVSRKRSLIRHIVAFILAWILFFAISHNSFLGVVNFRGDIDEAPVGEAITFQQMLEDLPLPVINYNSHRGSFSVGPNGIWIDGTYNGNILNILDEFFPVANWERQTATTATFRNLERQVFTRMGIHRDMFFLGVLFTWGLWIVIRTVKIVRSNMRSKVARPDPIAMEYQRLRGHM